MSVMNIRSAIKNIRRRTSTDALKNACSELLRSLQLKTIGIKDVVKKLSEFILCIEDAKILHQNLPSILLALVSARIPLEPVFSNPDYEMCSDTEIKNHLKYSLILSDLSEHPDILQYALKYFEINKVSPFEVFLHFEDAYNVAPKRRRLLNFDDVVTDEQIVWCCYNLLKLLPKEFGPKWNWSKFVNNFSQHTKPETRWRVKECMAILTNMTEPQSKILTDNLKISLRDTLRCMLTNNKNKQVVEILDIIKNEDVNRESVVNIDGILLPLYDKTNVQSGKLIRVKSTVSNLRSLALAVASGHALSLMGPVGSGKTSLVEHLAAITGRKGVAFKKVQLGDQTDSRMLLGSHQCTDVPGEFVWRAGVLTEAVQNGHWLLLEDIDTAALDVASTLSSLLERNTLCVPGYNDSLPVTPGFQLFVTQRTLTTNYGFQKKMSNSSTLLQKNLTQINVEPLSRSELMKIIQKQYPALSTICSKMIKVFMMFSVGNHDTSLETTETADENKVNIIRGSRLISTRDLIKWCSRSVVGFDVSSPESALKVLQDALDIFTCSVSSPEDRLELAKKVGTCLGIVDTKSEFYSKHYKPNVSLTPNHMEVGRARVPRVEKTLESIDFDNKQVVFSFTRQSACLLERIACCVTSGEPVLLVGETGTGKTSSVQYLARQTGHKLIVINMNQQSDSADLLGGYKPVDMKYVIRPIRDEFEKLFKGFYNVEKNAKFLGHIETCYETENWTALVALMTQSHKAGVKRLTEQKDNNKLKQWLAFGYKLTKLEQQVRAASRLTFAFIEGSLVKAMQDGHWVLLDEINLASAEILECLAGLLEDKNESIDLLEKGDKVPIKRHPDFTLFACMNPATDVGKKDLPVGLRNRFTEFFIDELTERNDLLLLIGDYLYHMNLSGATLEAIFSFYATIRKEAKLTLVDGSGNTPHYSLRTLCRALTAAAKAKCGTVTRSLYEAFCLSFLTQLDSSSHPVVEAMIAKAVIGKKNIKAVLNQMIPEPHSSGQKYLQFEGHWIPQGKLEIDIPEGYIITPTVRKNLRDIARIVSLGRLPVLLQGDTSVGKTSLITYIAKTSGNYCVRINNHEHTDLQEYIGAYATDSSGKLVFKEGVLVEAMRKGYWIILDELNLAPSDVLEALNRVLDDNRELFIPETQQVVKADPNFMLFATQNPPGLYGGRKMLSRAFRNRFVELHFDEIPKKELETILHQRCHVPPAYCKKMINVMSDLQIRRRGSAAVQGKDGFITLRDLFRWGQRYKHASTLTDDTFYDWDQHIADEGYLILAGKVRKTDERSIIEEVILKNIKRSVNPDNLFSLHQTTSPVTRYILEMILNNQLEEFSHVVWTYNMRRLAVLIAKAFTFNEPVLLVGETGCGKTTICQVLAALKKRQLLTVNCHMHTESSDFLGGLRPIRQYKDDGRLFEWVDGPLIKAMENGNMFLADEISLADDSVLERLNSLLEPERQLVLAERGTEDNSDIVVITAESNFHFVGTMNPGGDFGKKELSPALRNRFTEIWCDSVSSRDDLLMVLEKSVSKGISLSNQEDGSSGIGSAILDFTVWLKNSEVTNKFPFSIRDLLSWVQFINSTVSKDLLSTPAAYVHGACMTFLDCFGTALTGHIDSHTLVVLRTKAINFLLEQIKANGKEYTENLREMLSNRQTTFTAESDETKFGIKPFYIEVGENKDISETQEQSFTFTAPTTGSNTLRLLRGLQLNKAILLEGNPGVGKTSLVTALAKSSGHKVVRINLSDQTDITDLFGTDLPTEDGSFIFKEGSFLNALQNGDWILLDELNLAPQPVLEGLNACLDHRGEVYIPELGRTFKVKQQTKLFACQNPLKQGGARRGLPLSFLNRFTQVYIDTLTKDDLIYIVESQYPGISKDVLHRIVQFNCKVAHEITEIQSWAHKGSPWEMNLRDIQRWCEAIIKDQEASHGTSPGKFVDMLYVNRMRTTEDKERMIKTYNEIFHPTYPRSDCTPQFSMNAKQIIIGDLILQRKTEKEFKNHHSRDTNLLVLRNQLPSLKAIAQCAKMNWLTILVGPTATGKSSIVQVLADLTGNDLQVVPVTSAMDVSDLLGGFEQLDYNRNLQNLFEKIESLAVQAIRKLWLEMNGKDYRSIKIMSQLYKYKSFKSGDNDMTKFNEKIIYLTGLCEKILKCNDLLSVIRNEVLEVIADLKKLQLKACRATSVNAGGKFEWVDSLLVKSLIKGSWLLLDNVNLTSAAVLDRLNALLEPNGVLSIPERGDVSDIKPHPDFRVFFTMDPKYGEISRAMRNRGVEIYLLRDDFNMALSETMTAFDLSALLSSVGLPFEYHELCISCHELMAGFIQGLERPTLSHLLQVAHLISQQLSRGIHNGTALMNSFSDVYIKPRSGADFVSEVNMSLAENKNCMLKSLKAKLFETLIPIPYSDDSWHTLTVKGLCANSSFELSKQIALSALREIDAAPNAKTYMYVVSGLFSAYQKCSQELLRLCYKILKLCIDEPSADIDSVRNMTDKMNYVIHKFILSGSDPKSISFKRFYPELYNVSENETTEINKEDILKYSELGNIFAQQYVTAHKFTVLIYSKTILAKKMLNEYEEYPILKYCHHYLITIDHHIIQAISAFNKLDDASACKILQVLSWRNRFMRVTGESIHVSTPGRGKRLNEAVIPRLYIHSKWLQKYLMGELFKHLPAGHTLIKSFNDQVKEILSQHDQENTVIRKLGKKIRKVYGQPKLFESYNEYEKSVLRSSIYKKLFLNLGLELTNQWYKLSADGSTLSDFSFALDVTDTSKLALIEENIPKSQEVTSELKSETTLLPFTAYVVQRVLSLLQTTFLDIVSKVSEGGVTDCDVTVITSLVQFGRQSKGFPLPFLDQLELVLKIATGQEFERVSSVPVRFWTEFYGALISSPANFPQMFLALDKPTPSLPDETSGTKNSVCRVSGNLPLMPLYVQETTVWAEVSGDRHVLLYEKVPIENITNYSNRLNSVLNVIWKNIATLDSSAELKIKMDAAFEMKKYKKLIHCLYSIIAHDDAITDTEDLSEENMQLIKSYFKDNPVYATSIIETQKIYSDLQAVLSNKIDPLKAKILTTELSMKASMLFFKLMAQNNPVDHVERYSLKVQYIKEDIETLEAMLNNYYYHGLVSGTIVNTKYIVRPTDITSDMYESEEARNCLKKVHPYCAVLMQLKEETADRIRKYALGNTFRPNEPTYSTFIKDCQHFTSSILSPKLANNLTKNIFKTCDILYNDLKKNIKNQVNLNDALALVNQMLSWLFSVKAFQKKLADVYSEAFPDLAMPLESSLTQIIYSYTSMGDVITELVAKIRQGPIWQEVKSLIEYPITIPKSSENEEYMNRFMSDKFTALLKRNAKAGNLNVYSADIECIEVLKMNLTELRMHCTARDNIDKTSLDVMLTVLNRFYETWEKQEQDIIRKRRDDEALYVTKSKCQDEDEEKIAIEEIQEMFPSYSEKDFAEFKPPTLEQVKEKTIKKPQNTDSKPLKLLITNDIVSLVYNWHSNFLRTMTSAEWLTSKKKLVGNDVISPFMQRYPTFSRITLKAWEALDAEDEGFFSPSLMVLISQIKNTIDGNDATSKIDFYKSPWISETKQCVPLLQDAKKETKALLEQWPDFPTLKEIMVIINRILEFPIQSPISRFLTGLELLRDKIEEWNKNSHKGNNMIDMSLAVGQQIVNWRKLEMAHWKECLNNLHQRKQAESHKYWFFIYSVVNDHLLSPETNTAEAGKVTEALKKFMETSNLAEYEVRLDIIYAYHCNLVHMEPSFRRDELLSILWNTYNYYAQFSAQVAAQIKEKRAPIEKKLRDFVKICSWDRDLSYWSVKDTVEKAHKALHKHTKEFENVLKTSVISCLVDSGSESTEHVGLWDRPKRATASAPAGGAYMIDPTNHIVLVRNIKKYLDEAEQPCPNIPEGSLISKVTNLLNKAKMLCKDTITNTGYPALVQALDDFVTMVIENSTHLGSLEVDAALPKEKQTSQAKNIVRQKRKALADLFKYLSKMGLNYRTGLVIMAAANGELYDFTIPPVDLDAAISYLKPRRCDASLALMWSGCEKYFQKNIARHRMLSAALQSPHTDLGIQNIERCKGFAAHLLQLTNTQKKSIAKYSRRLCDMRTLTTSLMNALEIDNAESNISTVQQKFDILTECYANAGILLEQYCYVLKSCPEKGVGTQILPDFDTVLSDSKIVRCYKNSEEWKDLYKEIKTLISDIDKQKNALQKVSSIMPQKIGSNEQVPFISQSHIDTVEDSRSDLELIHADVDRIINEYQIRFKTLITDYEPKHPLLRSIVELSAYLKNTVKEIDALDKDNDVPMEVSSDVLIGQTEDLIATLLLVVQSVYKKHLPQENENSEVINAIDDFIGEKAPEEVKDVLEDKHLKELLQDKITSDTRALQLDTLVSKIRNLLVNYVQYLAVKRFDVGPVRSAVMRLVPILEQTLLFVQYFVAQKVAVHRVSCKMLSILLKIFSDLATKGFCKPSDLDMEEGEGEGGPGKLSGGTGLGDGEGQKDVSERIENQDQLDDAHRPGEEKKEEERDCKEEEKGVNMTDDFDSHLQDVDKKDDETSDKEDEDNADKQMGDTENAAEKLDQQIWGDEDEEPEQSEKKEKEDKGPGESTGEKEMAAKEKEEGTDDGSDGKDKQQKKDINEMEEPEVDDDQVDPYHGNQQPLPEPEDFEMPENMDIDGEEGEDKDGETETENPFEIDVMKDTAEEEEPKDKEENKDINDLSTDEEDGNENDSKEEGNKEDGTNEDSGEQSKEDDSAQPEETNDDQNPEDSDKPQDAETTEAEQETEESKPEEELPKNSEDITEDDKIEEKNHEANPQANPSSDDPTANDKAETAEMDKGTNDNVETNAEQAMDEDAAPFEQAQEQVGDEKQSTGRSELDKSDKGHRGEKQAASQSDTSQQKQKKHENKPGMTDQDRTLGDINQRKHKQTHTLDVERDDENAEDGADPENKDTDADAFQHVKKAKMDDLQAIDAATKEQAEEQPTIQQENEEGEELKEDEQVKMDVDNEDIQVEKSDELKPEKVKEGVDKDKEKSGNKKDGSDEPTGETGVEVEGEKVDTEHVPRGNETTYHTRLDEASSSRSEEMTVEQYMGIREWLTTRPTHANASSNVWRSLWQQSGGAARALCERLRLVLEPTLSSRRAGDFRTGRAINMRRVIPYIASHFRKDRIWLRRTKPAKREYKIAIAVDDSSSMADNRSKELAFESLALVSQALNLLESGELAVLSFGEKPNLLHPFTEQFSEHSGAKILEQLRFEQTKTKIAQLMDFCTVMFEEQAIRSDAPNARLLVIVGDGRNIFAEGETTVVRAVRRARQQGIFLVYVIIDNPDNRDSIMDIRKPVMDTVTDKLSFISYLDAFPFPFYLILRDMSALPNVLGDALRQWFELAANTG